MHTKLCKLTSVSGIYAACNYSDDIDLFLHRRFTFYFLDYTFCVCTFFLFLLDCHNSVTSVGLASMECYSAVLCCPNHARVQRVVCSAAPGSDFCLLICSNGCHPKQQTDLSENAHQPLVVQHIPLTGIPDMSQPILTAMLRNTHCSLLINKQVFNIKDKSFFPSSL